MTSEADRDRQVARETVRPRSECPSCNPPGPQPELRAIIPSASSRATVVHLHLPGYAPHDHSMCNAVSPTGTAKARRHTISLDSARTLVASGVDYRWCAFCVSRAAEHYGLLPTIASTVLDTARRART